MAINIKSSTNYLVKLMPLLGVPGDIVKQYKDAGIIVSQGELGYFKVQRFGKTFASVLISSTAMQMLTNGVLGKQTKASLLGHFNAGFQAAMASVAPPTSFEAGTSPVISTVLPVHAHSIPAKGSMQPCKLSEAQDCYLPSMGSSSGAIYYVVARYTGLNIALKSNSGGMALRAEGSDLEKYTERLALLGFKNNGGYSSVHFKAVGKPLIVKTLGALVASLGFDNLLKVVNPSKFAEDFCV